MIYPSVTLGTSRCCCLCAIAVFRFVRNPSRLIHYDSEATVAAMKKWSENTYNYLDLEISDVVNIIYLFGGICM